MNGLCRLDDERAVSTKSTFRPPHCEQVEVFGSFAGCSLGTVARGLLGWIGLDPMLAIAAPHDESDLGGGGRREVTHSGRRSRPAVG